MNAVSTNLNWSTCRAINVDCFVATAPAVRSPPSLSIDYNYCDCDDDHHENDRNDDDDHDGDSDKWWCERFGDDSVVNRVTIYISPTLINVPIYSSIYITIYIYHLFSCATDLEPFHRMIVHDNISKLHHNE